MKLKQKQIIYIIILLTIIGLLGLLLFLYFKNDNKVSISDPFLDTTNNFSSSSPILNMTNKFSSSNPFLDINNIKDIKNDIIIWKKNALDPKNKIGYPNLRKDYVVCYLNSALQLIKTFFINLFQMNSNLTINDIPETILYFLNFIHEKKRHEAVNAILKLIVPNDNTRMNSFYINKRLRQSDSSEFLLYFLEDYLFEINKDFKNVFRFDFVSSLQNINTLEIFSTNTKEDMILNILINEFKDQKINDLSIILQSIISASTQKVEFQNAFTFVNKIEYYSNFSSFLLISLKLFYFENNTPKKIDFYTYIPELITFTTNDSIVYNYTPISIICHQGGQSANSGHYINYSKDIQNNKWYLYNDINVYEILDNSLNKSIEKNKYNPYVILLKRIL